MEHSQSLVIPPHFDGNNYAYWKVRMKAFLKSIDERVWNSIEYGLQKPTTPVSEWSTSQKEVAAYNSKAMNTIFNVVSMEEFKRILNVEIAHTAWNILQIRLIWLCFNGSKNKHDPLKNKVGIHEQQKTL